MSDFLLVVLLLALLLLLAFTVPLFGVRRAMRALVKLFREDEITSPLRAKTCSELNINLQSRARKAFAARDYRPDALKVLVQAKIVLIVEGDKVYLSEQNLKESSLRKYL